jgi:hypothetical protein
MYKYHKEIGFYSTDVIKAKELINTLNNRKLSFSTHAIQELTRESQAVQIGIYLRDISLNFNDVFEVVIDNDKIEKLGFRVKFNEKDIVFIISRNKCIITIWTNNKGDKHFTLDKNKYCSIT